jgi:hypothetical protein
MEWSGGGSEHTNYNKIKLNYMRIFVFNLGSDTLKNAEITLVMPH